MTESHCEFTVTHCENLRSHTVAQKRCEFVVILDVSTQSTSNLLRITVKTRPKLTVNSQRDFVMGIPSENGPIVYKLLRCSKMFQQDFKASNMWLSKWKGRHNVGFEEEQMTPRNAHTTTSPKFNNSSLYVLTYNSYTA